MSKDDYLHMALDCLSRASDGAGTMYCVDQMRRAVAYIEKAIKVSLDDGASEVFGADLNNIE